MTGLSRGQASDSSSWQPSDERLVQGSCFEAHLKSQAEMSGQMQQNPGGPHMAPAPTAPSPCSAAVSGSPGALASKQEKVS